MGIRKGALGAGAALFTSVLVAAPAAWACGGSFESEEQGAQQINVGGQRMALAISKERTVLWSQVRYFNGAPEEFAWVLPVREGAKLEAADAAWLDALDAASSPVVLPPANDCRPVPESGGSGCGCGSLGADDRSGGGDLNGGEGGGGTQVVSQGTVGPYETVTLDGSSGKGVQEWLQSNGYRVPPNVVPVLEQYVTEGFQFVALRLKGGAQVSDMKPVRVVTEGGSPAVPLRMMIAGAGALLPVSVFVVGEGAYQAQNFPNAHIDESRLVWDWDLGESNYGALRAEAGDDTFWQASTVSPVGEFDPSAGEAGQSFLSIPFRYFAHAGDSSCNETEEFAEGLVSSSATVRDCAAPGAECDPATTIDAAKLACGEHTDLAAALVGMMPSAATVTRLDVTLTPAGLAKDLALEATATKPARVLEPSKTANPECTAPGQSSVTAKPVRANVGALALAALAAAGLLRRTRRPRG